MEAIEPRTERAAAANPPPTIGAAGKADTETPSEDDERWKSVLGLPCELSVELPLPNFRVADLMKLRAGSVIDTGWHLGQDIPWRINGTLIGWSEFEVVNHRLAVRLTELA